MDVRKEDMKSARNKSAKIMLLDAIEVTWNYTNEKFEKRCLVEYRNKGNCMRRNAHKNMVATKNEDEGYFVTCRQRRNFKEYDIGEFLVIPS